MIDAEPEELAKVLVTRDLTEVAKSGRGWNKVWAFLNDGDEWSASGQGRRQSPTCPSYTDVLL